MLNLIYGKRRNYVKHINYGLSKISKKPCKIGLLFLAITMKATSHIFPQDTGKKIYACRLLTSSDVKGSTDLFVPDIHPHNVRDMQNNISRLSERAFCVTT
jgi:hypothetical protein